MANKASKTEQNGKVKVRIIEFEMEGSDISLQESLKSITAALSRPSAASTPRPVRYPQISRQLDGGESGGESEEVEEAELVEEIDQVQSTSPKRPRKPAKVVTPTVLRDVRFDDVSPTFAEFATDRNPKGDLQRCLCVAFWLKTYKDIAEININHIYTAFKVVGWPIPTNVVQPLRELAATRDGRFSKGVEKGAYAINHVGENFINKLGNP